MQTSTHLRGLLGGTTMATAISDVAQDVAYHLDGATSGEITYTTAYLESGRVEVTATHPTGRTESFVVEVTR